MKKAKYFISLLLLAVLALMVSGCSDATADAKKAVQNQIDQVGAAYEDHIKAMEPNECFSGFSAEGIDPGEYMRNITKAASVKLGDVTVKESEGTASVVVVHPDCDDLVRLMGEKGKEFEASDDYLDFGQAERFDRSRELLNEGVVGCATKESTVEVGLKKSDNGWALNDDVSSKVFETLVTPSQTEALAVAMKPFSWKYDGMNASQIAETIKASGLPVGDIQAFDEVSDPNGLLGRPGEYTSKCFYLDTRIHDKYGSDWFDGRINTDLGGTIEVFDNLADAKKRSDYLQGLMDSGASFNKMYQYRKGTVLLRVGFDLVPSQAAEYETEFYQKSAK